MDAEPAESKLSSISHKSWFAIIAVAVALTGVFTGIKWLTVLALVVWVSAMLVFGRGRRDRNRPQT